MAQKSKKQDSGVFSNKEIDTFFMICDCDFCDICDIAHFGFVAEALSAQHGVPFRIKLIRFHRLRSSCCFAVTF
jgi:hypothetical protein